MSLGKIKIIYKTVFILAIAGTSTQIMAQKDANTVKCATRISIAVLGQASSSTLLKSKNPQSDPEVDAMFTNPIFIERYARFINSKFNDDPGSLSIEDSAYHLAKYVLENDLEWKELFLGQYNIVNAGTEEEPLIQVQVDPQGLGYFRNPTWMARYAGNDLAGLRINTAFRIQNNILGLNVETVTLSLPDDADVSAAGREGKACRGCHVDSWFALDKVADVLSRVVRDENNAVIRYDPSPTAGTPKMLFGSDESAMPIQDDKELIEALVASEGYYFQQCRLAFEYLYGRPENECEGTDFDKCVKALKADGNIQSGLKALVENKSFCQQGR